MINIAKHLNINLGSDSSSVAASLGVIKSLEQSRLDLHLQSKMASTSSPISETMPEQTVAVTEHLQELVDTMDELSLDEDDEELSPRVFVHSARKKKKGVSPECFSVKPVVRGRGRRNKKGAQ